MKAKQFLVLGLGRFGTSLARSLCELGHEVLAIDTNADLVDDIAPHVTQAMQMDATDEDLLRGLGVNNFDAAIVSIGQNTRDSILLSVLLKELGVPYLVAKANDDLHAKVLRKLGVDRVVFPERDMGTRVARSLLAHNVLDLMNLDNDYQLIEVRLPTGWAGKTLANLNVRRRYGISILAIHRNDTFIASPEPDLPFEPDDTLLVMGKKDDVDKLDA